MKIAQKWPLHRGIRRASRSPPPRSASDELNNVNLPSKQVWVSKMHTIYKHIRKIKSAKSLWNHTFRFCYNYSHSLTLSLPQLLTVALFLASFVEFIFSLTSFFWVAFEFISVFPSPHISFNQKSSISISLFLSSSLFLFFISLNCSWFTFIVSNRLWFSALLSGFCSFHPFHAWWFSPFRLDSFPFDHFALSPDRFWRNLLRLDITPTRTLAHQHTRFHSINTSRILSWTPALALYFHLFFYLCVVFLSIFLFVFVDGSAIAGGVSNGGRTRSKNRQRHREGDRILLHSSLCF